MNKIMQKNRGHLVAVLAVAVITASLVACGGGGGGSNPAVVTQVPVSFTEKVTCPTGVEKSATGGTQAEALGTAKALCPAVTGTISAEDGISPDDLFAKGFSTTTNGSMQVPNVDNVKLYAGASAVGATVSLSLNDFNPKSFMVKTTNKPMYASPYTYVANLVDGLGRPFQIVKTFTTGNSPPPVCTAPAMQNSLGNCMSPPTTTGYTWNTVIKVWVADIGTLVVGLNVLPAECVTVGDACWKESSANGKIKYFATGMTVNGNGRALVFGGFFIGGSGRLSGFFNLIPIYADTEADTPGLNKGLAPGALSVGFVSGKGSQVGVKFTMPTGECGEKFFDGNGITSRSNSCSD